MDGVSHESNSKYGCLLRLYGKEGMCNQKISSLHRFENFFSIRKAAIQQNISITNNQYISRANIMRTEGLVEYTVRCVSHQDIQSNVAIYGLTSPMTRILRRGRNVSRLRQF